MKFDISEIGAIQCQLNFDEDYYLDYLQENGLQDSDDVKKEYIKGQCDYDVTYLDSEYFHDMGEYDTMTIEEIEEEFGNRCAEDVFITCMDGREHDFEIQAYQDSIDINNPKELNAEAVKCLRHGGYFKNCRGFILTNGVVVYTGAEHNMCSKIPGINGTFDFIRLGNIRVLNHGVDIAKPPTEEQKKVLNQMFQSYYGEELYLDLMNDKNGHTGKKYNSCEPYEVMQDIYDYFNSGRLRQNTYESVKIDLNDIKQMVSECVKKILSEGISNITYHFTSLESCIDILKLNSFNLTMSSNKSDVYDNKKLFYLSTQRSRNKELGYAGHLGSCVRIQLDGKKIMEKYSGKPIDYWGASMGKQSYYNPEYDSSYGKGFGRARQTHYNFEMEDRILSYEPNIPNASKYITRIDVYIDPREDRLSQTKVQKYIDEINQTISIEKEKAILIYMLSLRHKLPVYVYNNLKQFNNMTDNTINDEIVQLYKEDFYSSNEKTYKDQERYQISKSFRNTSIYITILCELMNVLSLGKIYNREQESYKLIAVTLKKFGLEKYIKPVIDELSHRWGNSFEESCYLLSNTINAPIRKLNTEIPDSDDSNRIMRLGAYVLRKYKCSNFNDLSTKWRELTYE